MCTAGLFFPLPCAPIPCPQPPALPVAHLLCLAPPAPARHLSSHYLPNPTHPTAPPNRIPANLAPTGGSTPAIRQQLEALGENDVGYACRRFPQLGLSVIGGRPFSRGGTDWAIVKGVHCEGGWGLGNPCGWLAGGRLLKGSAAALSPAPPSRACLVPLPLQLLYHPCTHRMRVPHPCRAACLRLPCTALYCHVPPSDFYEEQYSIGGFQDSAHRILDLALQAPPEDLKVGLAVGWRWAAKLVVYGAAKVWLGAGYTAWR